MQPSSTSIDYTKAERESQREFVADDGTIYYGEAAKRAADAHFARSEAEHRAAVERMRTQPRLWRAYLTRLRVGTWCPPAMRPVARPTRPTRTARIGRTKKAVRTSTPSRGDPDDDPHLVARTCALDGCDASLAGMRADARYCGPTHRGMVHRGEPYLPPGRCLSCGGQLLSGRAQYCSGTCRNRAWRARGAPHMRRLQTATGAIQGVPGGICRCESSWATTDLDGDRYCIKCGRAISRIRVAA